MASRKQPKEIDTISLTPMAFQFPVTVNPVTATRWLAFAAPNRNRRVPAVATMVDDMRNKRWKVNGSTIVFAQDGRVIDGTNRLQAIINSGATIDVFVVVGIHQDDALFTLDTGSRRKPGDTLGMVGEHWCSILSSALRYLFIVETSAIGKLSLRMSPFHTLSTLERHPGLRDFLSYGNRVNRAEIKFTAGVGAAMYYTCTLIDKKTADKFFHGLEHGTGLSEGQPVLALRRALAKGATRGTRGKERMRGELMHALAIKAWNATMNGDSLKIIKWAKNEAAPEFVGAREALLKEAARA